MTAEHSTLSILSPIRDPPYIFGPLGHTGILRITLWKETLRCWLCKAKVQALPSPWAAASSFLFESMPVEAQLCCPVLNSLQYWRGWSTLLGWGKELCFTLGIYSFIMVFSSFHLASHVFSFSWICTKIPHSKLCIPANSNQPVSWLRFIPSLIFICFGLKPFMFLWWIYHPIKTGTSL